MSAAMNTEGDHVRRLVVVATAVVSALTGCSGGQSDGRSADAGKTATAGAQAPAPAAPSDLHAYLTLAADRTFGVKPKHVLSSITITGPSGTRHVQTVDGHRGQQPDTSDAVLVTDGSHAEARVMGTRAWLSSAQPQLVKAMPAGKTWLELSSVRLAAAGIPTTDDQLALLHALRGARQERDGGVDRVQGVAVRRFTARIDLDQAVCHTPVPFRSDVRQLFVPGAGVDRPITAQAWVDAFKLVRRLTLTVDLGSGAASTYDVQLPGDNATVPVTAPPESGTVGLTDVPALAKALPAGPKPAPAC